MIDSPPICRVCARRGITALATWRLDDDTVTNWTLCERHAIVVGRSALNLRGKFSPIPNPHPERLQQPNESDENYREREAMQLAHDFGE